MKNTIEDLALRLEDGLSRLRSREYSSLERFLDPLIPQGYRAHVSLLDKSGRKKRRDASADNWSPESGEIRIYFEPEPPSSRLEIKPATTPAKSEAQATKPTSDPMSELIRALDRAESRPGYAFVALKWFRDVVLPGFDWAQSESTRQNVLREAIEKRFVLTYKVSNPKSPEFPVTAVRLNRLLPEIQTILGQGEVSDSDFDPVQIPGANLSATVLRERR